MQHILAGFKLPRLRLNESSKFTSCKRRRVSVNKNRFCRLTLTCCETWVKTCRSSSWKMRQLVSAQLPERQQYARLQTSLAGQSYCWHAATDNNEFPRHSVSAARSETKITFCSSNNCRRGCAGRKCDSGLVLEGKIPITSIKRGPAGVFSAINTVCRSKRVNNSRPVVRRAEGKSFWRPTISAISSPARTLSIWWFNFCRPTVFSNPWCSKNGRCCLAFLADSSSRRRSISNSFRLLA